MKPYYEAGPVTLYHGDCRTVMAAMPDASVDAIVTDPPYELTGKSGGGGFMGKSWDSTGVAFDVAVWCEALRVLKPGGHLLAFGGSRTYHRMAVAIEDAGFELRDSIAWLYGSGMPKSLDVSKAIDKRGDDAGQWQGWGTALKPSHEPVVCARKPFNAVPLGEEVDRLHHLIGGLLWLSLSPAKRAELTSPSSPAGQHEAPCASALVSAALNTSPDASDETATFSSPALASTSSSIASSWSATLGALSARTRTSTTSTASSTTTALRTLNSLLGPITSQTTMPRCGCLVDGPSSPAPSAASSSSDEWAKWLHTLSASVPATATEGIALAVASALASIASDLSDDPAAASSADPTATTGAAASRSAFEPIVVARKPLVGVVAANVLAFGTGALNIGGCRVPTEEPLGRASGGWQRGGFVGGETPRWDSRGTTVEGGRWPTNVVLDESQAALLDAQSGRSVSRSGGTSTKAFGLLNDDAWVAREVPRGGHDDQGGASRFFPTFKYEAKAPTSERPVVDGVAHATVKPLKLMQWLVRLVTPPGGVVLDPFAGSGTTLEAAVLEGFDSIGIELEEAHLPLIKSRFKKPFDQYLDLGDVG